MRFADDMTSFTPSMGEPSPISRLSLFIPRLFSRPRIFAWISTSVSNNFPTQRSQPQIYPVNREYGVDQLHQQRYTALACFNILKTS